MMDLEELFSVTHTHTHTHTGTHKYCNMRLKHRLVNDLRNKVIMYLNLDIMSKMTALKQGLTHNGVTHG